MAIVNHLRNIENQRSILEVAFGEHVVKGDLCYSYSTGSDPTHYVYGYNALGEGEWESMDGAWYSGLAIPEADINFHNGALATAMVTGPQIVDSHFAEDVPHSRTAAVGYKLPQGVADVNTSENPPTGFTGIFKCKKCPDYNSSGVWQSFDYSVNPARVIMEIIETYARIPNVPSTYTDMLEYWVSRIDWGRWTDFRDWHDTTETVDYFGLTDFEGIGASAVYFDDATWTTEYTRRIEPTLDFQMGSGSPAYGMSTDNYSARIEGQFKPEYTETYTFHGIATSIKYKLWVDGVVVIDQSGAEVTGTHTGTAALVADTSSTFKLEFVDVTGDANLSIEWSSASQTQIPIPMRRIYPKSESQVRYEAHVVFKTQTSIMDAIKEVLFQTNSIMQDVNGKIRFYALEELTSTFTFNDSNIIEGSVLFERSDILLESPVTRFEASMNDLDSQYLEKPVIPVFYDIPWLDSRTRENVSILNLHNCTQWQARKILEIQAELEMGKQYAVRLESLNSDSYEVIAGDRISLTHRKIVTGKTKDFLVIESNDQEVSSPDDLSDSVLRRGFTLHEWNIG